MTGPALDIRRARQAVRARRIAHTSERLADYVNRVDPTFRWHRHNEEVAEVLQAVVDGELDRVMIFEPPRHGKSHQVSRHLPAYYLHLHPHRFVGHCSYGAALSYSLSRKARELYLEGGGALAEDAATVSHWETTEGGGLWAAGVGGAITGKGFHLGIIDDAIKNRQDAESELVRQKQCGWYESTFYTRREPDAAIVMVVTRWHERDLPGYLLGGADFGGDSWYVVALDAIRDDRPYGIPETCEVHPDWREPGEPLCPERFDLDDLERARAGMTDYEFSALYQQRPTAREGNRFQVEWFEQRVKSVPSGSQVRRIRGWDEASTEGGGDYTAGVLMSRDFESGRYYVEHVKRGQWSSGKRDEIQRATAEQDARHHPGGVTQWVQQEPGSAGKDRARAFVRLMDGLSARFETVTGSKEIRADPYASQLEIGNVFIVEDGTWDVERFVEEHLSFPHGQHDDQVDAAAFAFNHLSSLGAPEDPNGWLIHA